MDGTTAFWESTTLDNYELHAWMTVSGGYEYLFEVDGWSSDAEPVSFNVAIEHQPITDAYERNDSWEEAPIISGTIHGMLHAGYESSGVCSEDYDDWYTYKSSGKPLEVALTDVPEDILAGIEIWDPSDMEWTATWESAWEPSMDVSVNFDPDHSGDYLIRVQAYGPYAHGTGDIPESFTQPYTLSVSTN